MSENETLTMLLEKTKQAEKLIYDSSTSVRFDRLMGEIRRTSFIELKAPREKRSAPFTVCMSAILIECKSETSEEPVATDWAARLYRIRESIEGIIDAA
jgi:hypothetical protein